MARLRHIARLAAPLALTLAATTALADAVKLSGFWIENATVQTVVEGQLVYTTPTGGRVTKPLAEVEGLRFSAYPEVEKAQTALDAGDGKAAAALVGEALKKARQEWATRYMQRLLVEALAAPDGDAAAAARAFADLVRTDPDPFFVPEPPVEAVAAASDGVKSRVREALGTAAARTPERYRDAVNALLAAADAPAAAEPAATTPPAEAAPAPTAAGSAVLLPQWADEADPVVQALRRGEFRVAIELVDRQMTNPDLTLAKPLFYKGLAQLGLAEQADDAALYKDAGLSFMRVVTFYDPKTTAVPVAMIEAGYVHQKIGRPDIADRLFESARALLDEEADPAYYQRLLTLMGVE